MKRLTCGLVALMLASCAADDERPPPGIAVSIAPLTLPGAEDVCYGVYVQNGSGALVAYVPHVCSSRYGNGAGGDISLVLPCDAQAFPTAANADHRVTLVLEGVDLASGAATTWLDETQYRNPCGWPDPAVGGQALAVSDGDALPIDTEAYTGPGASAAVNWDGFTCQRVVRCEENADAAVAFDLTVMRDADQGWFDIAVDFEDIFCSAKVDCAYPATATMPSRPIELVFDPETGERVETVVIALACTDGDPAGASATATHLYMDDIELDCGATDYEVPASAGPGNIYPDAGTPPAPVAQAMEFEGRELITNGGVDADKLYWNLALGLDPDFFHPATGTVPTCTLRTQATASKGPLPGGVTPLDTDYPVIDVAVVINADDTIVCTQHDLDGTGTHAGVATGYTGALPDGSGFGTASFDNEGAPIPGGIDTHPIGGGPTDTMISISGTTTCFEGCHPPLIFLLMHPGSMMPMFSMPLPTIGPYEVEVPAGLGPVEVYVFEDSIPNMSYQPGEYVGKHGGDPTTGHVIVGGSDLTGIDVDIPFGDPDPFDTGGIADALGTPIELGELIVFLEPGAVGPTVAAAAGLTLLAELPSLDAIVLAVDAATLPELAAAEAALMAVDGVLRVERSARVLVPTARVTDDNEALPFVDVWAYDRVRAKDARDLYDGCAYHFTTAAQLTRSVTVAIVDFNLIPGVTAGSEFAGLTFGSIDHYTTRDTDPASSGHHGSAVASVIAALNDGDGMNGMLAGFVGTVGSSAIPYAINYLLDLHNMGYSSSSPTLPKVSKSTSASLLAALEGAAAGPAKVINVSIGNYATTVGHYHHVVGLRAKIAAIIDANPAKVFVFAAGNDEKDLDTGFHLSSLDKPNLIVVGAYKEDDTKSSFTNYGSYVDVCAPGTSVYTFAQRVVHTSAGAALSTSTYESVDGTSFAAPIVAAHVALVQAMEPLASPASILSRLTLTGDPGPAGLGRAVHFARLVQFQLENEINTGTDWLMDLESTIVTRAGPVACDLADEHGGHQCLALVGVSAFVKASGTLDHNGNDFTLSGTLAGTGVGSAFSMDISGEGVTHGIGPATHTYTGTVAADLSAVPGNVYVTGDFTQTTAAPSPVCTFTGTFEAWLRKAEGPP